MEAELFQIKKGYGRSPKSNNFIDTPLSRIFISYGRKEIKPNISRTRNRFHNDRAPIFDNGK
jgi:hypothetical protein